MRKKGIRIRGIVGAVLLSAVVLVLLCGKLGEDDDGVSMTAGEIASFDVYDLAVPEGQEVSEFVLPLCSFDRTVTTEDGQEMSYYSGDRLQDHLYDCAQVNAVCVYQDYVVISYTTTDGDDVGLTYEGNKLAVKTFCDSGADLYVRIYDDGAYGMKWIVPGEGGIEGTAFAGGNPN